MDFSVLPGTWRLFVEQPHNSPYFLTPVISWVSVSSSLMAEKSLPNPVSLSPLAGPDSTLPAGTGATGPNADDTERGGALDGMVGSTGMEEEEEEEGRREVAEGVPETEEREEEEKEGGRAWPDGAATDDVGDFPLREGGIMLGASSVGSSFPRTFSAMRCIARANCSTFSLPLFCESHRFLERQRQKRERRNLTWQEVIFYLSRRQCSFLPSRPARTTHQTWARTFDDRFEAMNSPLASSPDTSPSLSLSIPSKYLSYFALVSAVTTHSWRNRHITLYSQEQP